MKRTGSLGVIFLTVFIDLLGFGMVIPLLPKYAEQFTVDEHGLALGLLMGSFSLMQFIFSPLWGRLSDRIGRRPVIMLGLAGSVVFYLLFGLATLWRSLAWMFVARVGAGICGATIATAQAYIADTTTLEQRARGMALIGAAFGLGFTFGPLLGAAALVTTATGEGLSPWPGYLASGLSALALAAAVFLLPESLHEKSRPVGGGWLQFGAWVDAWRTPSIPPLLICSFISVAAFGAFETTLSLLLSGKKGVFGFADYQVLLVFAYIGFMLALVQGGLVRRLAGKVTEATMATTGALANIAGLLVLIAAVNSSNLTLIFVAAAILVTGFAFLTPSLQSLVSRRSDPAKQGGILGVAQGVSSLARIVAPAAIPLLYLSHALPYWTAVGLMLVALALLRYAATRGRDYGSAAPHGGH